jgi:F0F1-type ATP synthase epsilon subunit
VRVPGLSGEFGILKDHVPTISQLKPGKIRLYSKFIHYFIVGVVGIVKKDKEGRLLPEEEYFVSGGFAFVHRVFPPFFVANIQRIPHAA